MLRVVVAAFLVVSGAAIGSGAEPEPRLIALGVWPNEVRLLDETNFEIAAKFPLRHGAVVMDSAGYTRTAHSADYRKLYLITDRMESVETVDLARREVVDEVKLSEPGRRVRIFNAVPSPSGGRLFLIARPVTIEADRFLVDGRLELFVYDTAERRLVKSFELPDTVREPVPAEAIAATDENTVFVTGAAVYAVNVAAESAEVAFDFTRPTAPGYGVAGGVFLCETEPFVYHAVYRSQEPALERGLTAVLRLDLRTRELASFDVAPWMPFEQVAVAPDGRRAYLGGKDLAAVDLSTRKLLRKVDGIERGRTNTRWIVSYDGTKLYVLGVGDRVKIYDTDTLQLVNTIALGADVMFAPLAVPRSILTAAAN